MKQFLTLLALFLGLGTANAQKINKKDFLKILEVPYSTIEDGDKILRELGCTEKDNSIPIAEPPFNWNPCSGFRSRSFPSLA